MQKGKKIETEVSCFALVVAKVPWYKKALKSLFGFFGYSKYEY